MDQHEPHRKPNSERPGAEGSASGEPVQRSKPEVTIALSNRLLILAAQSRLGSSEGDKLLREIEQLPSRAEQAEILNSTFSGGFPGRGVLALHRRGLNQKLLERLLSLGLDLSRTFPIEIGSKNHGSTLILKATIYHLAAIEGDLQLLKNLPGNSTLVNAQTQEGETPLVAAVKYGVNPKVTARVVEILAEHGADFSLRDSSNRHAFHYAFEPRPSLALWAILKAWDEKKIVPVNKFEARSGLAYTLLCPPQSGQRAVTHLQSLIAQAPDNAPLKGAPVSGILKRLETLLPQAESTAASSSKSGSLSRENSEARIAQLRRSLGRLELFSSSIGRAVMVHLVESPLPSSNQPLLAAAYVSGVGASALQMILNIGASLDTRFDRVGRSTVKVIGGTLLHHAINDSRFEVHQMLMREHSELATIVDGQGNTPIHTHLQAYLGRRSLADADTGLINDLLDAGCPADHVNVDGVRPVDLAIQLGDIETLSILDAHGAQKPLRDSMATFEVMNLKREATHVDYSGLLKTALKWRRRIILFESDEVASMLLDDASLVLRQTKSVHSAYLALVAGADAITQSRSFRTSPHAGTSLLKLAPSLLFHQPPNTLWGLWNAIDWISDNHRSVQRLKRHFNEAEMLLLLNHPKQRIFEPSELDPLTRAITATRRVADHGLTLIPHSTVWNLARIGLYTHGFHLSLKHDCEPALSYQGDKGWNKVGPSLLEKRLGMVRIGARTTDAVFGAGFLLLASPDHTVRARLLRRSATGEGHSSKTNPDGSTHQWYTLAQDTMMEFRRGYTLVSNPEFGTLLIRNSSLIFGRDTLRHSAYWMAAGYRNGYGFNELLELRRYDIERRMRHVLAPSVISSRTATDSIYELLRQLDIVRDLNRRLKFEAGNRDAFELDGDSGTYTLSSTGGYRASGFASIVDFLRQRFHGAQREIKERGSASREVPDLAFSMPWFPPWVTYRFAGEAGQMQSRLTINKDVLEVLQAYAQDSFTRELVDLDDYYGVGRFFQEAGFNNNAELVMLSPRE